MGALNIVRHENGKMYGGWQIFDAPTLFEQTTTPKQSANVPG